MNKFLILALVSLLVVVVVVPLLHLIIIHSTVLKYAYYLNLLYMVPLIVQFD